MLNLKQKTSLRAQYGRGDSLDQYAYAYFYDKGAGWDWWLLNLSPDEETAWAIIRMRGPFQALLIDMIELETLRQQYALSHIEEDKDFLPTQASYIWKKLKDQKSSFSK